MSGAELTEQFKSGIKQRHLFSPADRLLLAVSGGVDSVVLCELCKQAGFNFTIAHCNFQLRGEESQRDEEFVKDLAIRYNVELAIKKFETEMYAAEKHISIQEAARELRYAWFAELLTADSRLATPDSPLPTPAFLLTAHHADDNIETLSMNFFRGTGLHGLTGIPASAQFIRRPLLAFTKEQLLEFGQQNNLKFVEDSSNQSSKYTRNFFRNEIIPAIAKVYPQVKENLGDNIDRFKEIEELYRLSVGQMIAKISRQKGKELHIPVKQLMAFRNRALIYELISPYGFQEKQVDELIKLAGSDSGKFIRSPAGNYRIIKHRYWFIISPVESAEAENIIIEEVGQETRFSLGTLHTTFTANLKPSGTENIISLDAGEILFPLLLRKCKTGDYFYPLGMKKKKKLNRFFIDQKLSTAEKEKIWVIEMNKKIIWVLSHRIDDRFKITAATKNVIRFSLIAK